MKMIHKKRLSNTLLTTSKITFCLLLCFQGKFVSSLTVASPLFQSTNTLVHNHLHHRHHRHSTHITRFVDDTTSPFFGFRKSLALKETKFNGENSIEDNKEKSRKEKTKHSVSRMGGRIRQNKNKKNKQNNNKLANFSIPQWILLPLALFWFGSQFFGGGNNENFYYYSYSSSVYETRTMDANGQINTQRQEKSDFRSNIPGFSQQEQLRQVKNGNDKIFLLQDRTLFDDYFLDERISETLDDFFSN